MFQALGWHGALTNGHLFSTSAHVPSAARQASRMLHAPDDKDRVGQYSFSPLPFPRSRPRFSGGACPTFPSPTISP